jgi:uncharacterized protein (DUF2235 family)
MKNIVILSDGTGNGAAKRHGTNVRRLYDALDLHRPDQVAYYDDGVGSQEFLPLKLLGGVFGWGLKRNVLEMYAFLCRVYRDADETGEPDRIYLFGFSRGAFTVRVLAGMIAYCGLYGGFADEADLAKVARRNYRAFRSCYRRGYAYQLLRKLAGTTSEPRADTHPDIEFVGVWDTVDAYGLPIDELAILWDLFLYPIRFPDHDLSERVKRACHAVSVDDERLTFHPLLWNEAYPEGQRVPRIEQVWFPGVHSDVGGGYPESELALLSLDWMMTRVEARQPNGPGLHFIEDSHAGIRCHSDWHGKQHDSRSGLAAYYRYRPRQIEDLCNDAETGVRIDKPKIHRSVFERIKGGAGAYAPTGLPEQYEVVATEGAPPVYESAEGAAERRLALNAALDVVFWRRWLYGALLAATVLLLLAPTFLPHEAGGACDGSACLVAPLLSALQSLLPGIVSGWFETLSQNASSLWGFVVAFSVLFWLKARLLTATRCRAEAAWRKLRRGGQPPRWHPTGIFRFRSAARSTARTTWRWVLAVAAFLAILGIFLVAVDRGVFFVRAMTGGLCEASVSGDPGKTTVLVDIADPCGATGILLEKGHRYRIAVTADRWRDGALEASPDQMVSPPWYLAAAVPVRRHLGEPWMRLMGRVGAAGNDTFAVGAGLGDFEARTSGELFLYVNDAVFGILPGDLWALPYTWAPGPNQGSAEVTVTPLD